MKKLLLLGVMCLMAGPVLAGGLDSEDTTPKARGKSQLYTSAKLFGSFMNEEAEISGDYNTHEDYDTFKMGAGLTAGLRFDRLRTELEISRFGETDDKAFYNNGRERAFSKITNCYNVMINGYYDFKNKTAFTPYIGGGLGLARLRGKYTVDIGSTSAYESKRTTNLAWQAGAGVAYTLDEHFDIDLGYRYLDNGSIKIRDEGYDVKMKSRIHQFYTGLRFNF